MFFTGPLTHEGELTSSSDTPNFFILVFFIPLLAVCLLYAQLTLIAMDFIKPINSAMKHISETSGGGLSMCSWY
jgi:hypothetical protein